MIYLFIIYVIIIFYLFLSSYKFWCMGVIPLSATRGWHTIVFKAVNIWQKKSENRKRFKIIVIFIVVFIYLFFLPSME